MAAKKKSPSKKRPAKKRTPKLKATTDAQAGAKHVKATNWSEEVIREALVAFVQTGSVKGAARSTGVPHQRVSDFTRDPEWAEELGRIRHAHARAIRDRHEAMALSFVDGLDEALTMARVNLRARPLTDQAGNAVLDTNGQPVMLPPDSHGVSKLGGFLVQGLTAVDRISLRNRLQAHIFEEGGSQLTDHELDAELRAALNDPELVAGLRDMGLNMGADEMQRLIVELSHEEPDVD